MNKWFVDGFWLPISDGDPRGRDLYRRHYSYRRYADGRNPRLFVGPGEKMVLLTLNADALFVWRKFISLDHQEGVNCAIFRNESGIRASDLIREAVNLAWKRWPGHRLYTYVNPRKVKPTYVRGTAVYGWCFQYAGWHVCGVSKKGLWIWELLP